MLSRILLESRCLHWIAPVEVAAFYPTPHLAHVSAGEPMGFRRRDPVDDVLMRVWRLAFAITVLVWWLVLLVSFPGSLLLRALLAALP